NVPAPQTVLQATALAVAYTAGVWTTIQFTTPYVHDGSSSLVIDIRKVVDPTTIAFVTMDNGQSPARTDRPQMVYGFGGPGSGAVNSPSAFAQTDPIAFRLRWSGAPTMRHSADRAASGQQYGLGGTVGHTIHGAAGAVFLSVIADSVLPVPVPVPPVVGNAWI